MINTAEHPEQSPEAIEIFEKLTSENKKFYLDTWDRQTYGEFGEYWMPDDYLAAIYKKQLESLNACDICGAVDGCVHYSECCTAPVEPGNVCSFCKKIQLKMAG